jgi:hypothetical protein
MRRGEERKVRLYIPSEEAVSCLVADALRQERTIETASVVGEVHNVVDSK